MPDVSYIRICNDRSGRTCFDDTATEVVETRYAPPAEPLFTSEAQGAAKTLFLQLPIGWIGEWHPTPVRQWLIILSGTCTFEVESGEIRDVGAGDAILLDDLSGKGHRTVVTGDAPVNIAAVHLT
ncbi:cupin domain-containing protein [Tepidamorphus sp. 3E244]|uniref:cupin domain-containing protein n=1 Tax=Tepidamorphus sp. 3E244 TaxID=3385498 RepID=UPI0038FCB769